MCLTTFSSTIFTQKKFKNMNKKELLKTVVDALEDVKGQDIRVYDTTKKTSAFDHIVIASGTSNRQTRALANSVAKAVKAAGGKVSGTEGTDTGEWVLVDCGSVVCHCMQPNIRQYYDLEELWGPDALDLKTLFSKVSEAEEEEKAAKPTRKRTATKKTAAKKTSASAAKKAKPAKKTTEKKVAAKKTTTAKKVATTKKDATAKKFATAKKPAAAKKPVAKKAPAKKPVAKKATPKKTTAKKD